MMKITFMLAVLAAMPAFGQEPDIAKLAAAFGARPAAWNVALAPDARRIVYLTPFGSGGTAAMIADIASGKTQPLMGGAGVADRLGLDWCGWKTEQRLICGFYGVSRATDLMLSYTRLIAIDASGANPRELGQRADLRTVGYNQYSGDVLSWLPDDPEHVLLEINIAETNTVGSNLRGREPGVSAQRIDIRTNSMTQVVPGSRAVAGLVADGRGDVRLRATVGGGASGYIRDRINYSIKGKTDGQWRPLGAGALTDSFRLQPLAFEESGDKLLALQPHNGRLALFRLATDGSGKSELVFGHNSVDIEDVLRIGKYRRPVAARYITDHVQYEYFDAALAKLTRSLSSALPGKPTVEILDESWDGGAKLVYAGSGGDPGRYFLYTSATRELNELLPLRPRLADVKLAQPRPITYAAADGTSVPGYLTLPVGSDGKNLPAIIMPHGGPGSRDDGGFDWWAQFYASLGYAVLQPNFRGSSGYGVEWYNRNGFQSWRTAIGDVNDGARWLIAQGVADPRQLAIVGWSYGGYAALQANVLEPTLYRAAIAVAPVADLDLLKEQYRRFENFVLATKFIGEGPHVAAGSPARHAAVFQAPVQLFSGDRDVNVSIVHSRAMERALKAAGKSAELTVYPGLDHQLDDSTARADMLEKSAAFLAKHVGR